VDAPEVHDASAAEVDPRVHRGLGRRLLVVHLAREDRVLARDPDAPAAVDAQVAIRISLRETPLELGRHLGHELAQAEDVGVFRFDHVDRLARGRIQVIDVVDRDLGRSDGHAERATARHQQIGEEEPRKEHGSAFAPSGRHVWEHTLLTETGEKG
jgi:hypothetical protein